MKIAVIGRNGQLARALDRLLGADVVDYRLFSRPELDLCKPETVQAALLAYRPAAVINAAAYTAVDAAEDDRDQAFAVNRDGPAALAESCATLRASLIHVSTDYVFDGSKTGAYLETDPVAPLGNYGASKLAGERAVLHRLDSAVILRTAWVFSADGRNFVKSIIRAARDKGALRVVQDQIGCPTPAADLARACLQAARARKAKGGVYHYAGDPPVSWFGFAQEIVRQAGDLIGRKVEVSPIGTADYPTRAARPANSCLDSSAFHRDFGVAPADWRAGLREVIGRLAAAAEKEARAS